MAGSTLRTWLTASEPTITFDQAAKAALTAPDVEGTARRLPRIRDTLNEITDQCKKEFSVRFENQIAQVASAQLAWGEKVVDLLGESYVRVWERWFQEAEHLKDEPRRERLVEEARSMIDSLNDPELSDLELYLKECANTLLTEATLWLEDRYRSEVNFVLVAVFADWR